MESDTSRDTHLHAAEQHLPNADTALSALDEAHIKNMIYTVRGQQVMLDSDLAQLYGVETKVLNRAVKRNGGRFPADFRFQLTRKEVETLRCQFGTLAGQRLNSSVGRTYLPFAFTEQGVAMLSAVLRSETALEVSVRIMRAFVEMRHFVLDNASLFSQVHLLEREQIKTNVRLDTLQQSTDERFERVFDYMEAHKAPTQKIFFEGQIYDAFEFVVSLIQQAKQTITLIDNYVDVATLNILAKKTKSVSAAIYTHPHTKLTNQDIDTFNTQYSTLTVHHTNSFHDRFLILDDAEGYLIGASLKDVGKKSFAIARLEDAHMIDALLKMCRK